MLPNSEGKQVPKVTFRTRDEGQWKDVTTESIFKGRTVIVIAHRLSSVRQAHRIIVLDKGRLVEEGSHEILVRRPLGLYAQLWSMQAGSSAPPPTWPSGPLASPGQGASV